MDSPRATRRSTRLAASSLNSPATTISTTNPSSACSTVAEPIDTPPTSGDESDVELPLLAVKGKERAAKPTRPTAKGRTNSQQVFVEIVRPTNASVGPTSQERKAPAKGKGKARAARSPSPIDDNISEVALEYDEAAEIEESEDSGSEFIVSDIESVGNALQSEGDADENPDEDDEIMLDAAIRISLQANNTASSSSSRLISANPAAILRAAAAEARLTRSQQGVSDVVDDSAMDVDEKRKGKKKATARSSPKRMTLKEMRAARRISKRENLAEERALRKELGRRLTHAEKSTIALHKHHPELKNVWGDLASKIPVPVPEEAQQPLNLKLTMLPFQRESLLWMKKQEQGVWNGGMLADEMGMGKTIQMIALLVSDDAKPNLVVAPTVAIMQWKNEISAHTDGLRVLVWHGAGRESKVSELEKFDVVLTTYSVLESCFRKQELGFKRKGHIVKERSPLHAAKWDRIITCFWNNEILTPIQKHAMAGPGETAFKKLKILLDRMMLRRTKLQRADDLGLPPRTVIVRRDHFSPEEKELYISLFSDAKRQFSTYLDEGTVLNNYSNIFSLLTRMRQMACHPDLVLRSKTSAAKFFKDEADESTVCRICNDVAEDAIQSKCRHIFDRECIKQYLDTAMEHQVEFIFAALVCHLPLTIDLDAPALELEQNLPNARQGILGRLNLDKWRSSTKIEALVEELSNLRTKDATTKSLVFSQFVNFLDLIAFRLQRAGFKICRLEGTMSPQARDATIKHFMNNVEVTVFLVSLKAGGVALNLTEASRVYLMDSWWNPAVRALLRSWLLQMINFLQVEFQAMDRIHRLGQRRPVKAIKLVVEDSIESRIVQLQEKKSAMINATLSTDDAAMGRLTPGDLSFLFRL
ncbi:unnamed protein product [Mycena citricolor]|uniref:Uncharacterized protein n=1 Tax=Mycena citricolor TaxID=2018698 RepID=A0AAD2GV92_9AGAR|nr:unnamed protein product [Mycena citricolor]